MRSATTSSVGSSNTGTTTVAAASAAATVLATRAGACATEEICSAMGELASQVIGPARRRVDSEIDRNALTTSGSNWAPAHRASSARAVSNDIGSL